MRADFAQTVRVPSIVQSIAAMIALLAVLLAAFGMSGLVSYVASLRAKEIGIRLALGASVGAIVQTLLGRTAIVATFGAILGLGGGWAAGQLFAGDPFYLEALDASPYAGAALVLGLSVTAAVLWPAIRLLRSDPLKALRVE
jgi:ABC-type antimicrobial peptide transport system permease subunit